MHHLCRFWMQDSGIYDISVKLCVYYKAGKGPFVLIDLSQSSSMMCGTVVSAFYCPNFFLIFREWNISNSSVCVGLCVCVCVFVCVWWGCGGDGAGTIQCGGEREKERERERQRDRGGGDRRRWDTSGRKSLAEVSGGEPRLTAAVAELRRITRDWELTLLFPADFMRKPPIDFGAVVFLWT